MQYREKRTKTDKRFPNVVASNKGELRAQSVHLKEERIGTVHPAERFGRFWKRSVSIVRPYVSDTSFYP